MNKFNELYSILEQFGYYDAQIKNIHFLDECGCPMYPCHLNIEITTMLSFTYETQEKLNEHIRDWAKENLTWKGCSGCENVLDVNCLLFCERTYQTDWAIPEPVKQVLVNSALYIGKDAISKIKALLSGEIPYTPIIVHLASQGRRKNFIVLVRKIDTYKDRIDLYTDVGTLSLYADTPIPITEDIIEAIEIPNKIRG